MDAAPVRREDPGRRGRLPTLRKDPVVAVYLERTRSSVEKASPTDFRKLSLIRQALIFLHSDR
jgi:hypothetical protein